MPPTAGLRCWSCHAPIVDTASLWHLCPDPGDRTPHAMSFIEKALDLVHEVFGTREEWTRSEVTHLLDLWRSWDFEPGEEEPARRLEVQVSRVAELFNLTSSAVRGWVVSNRAALGLPRLDLRRETPAERRRRRVQQHLEDVRAWRRNWRCLFCGGPLGRRAMYCSDACKLASVASEAHRRNGRRRADRHAPETRDGPSLFSSDELSDL